MSPKKSFKTLMDTIESITHKLEHEQSDLEASLKLFKDGQELIQEAKTRLEQMEHEFNTIDIRDDNPTEESVA